MGEQNRPSKLYLGLIFGAMVVVGLSMFQADLYGNYGKSTGDLDYLDVSQDVVAEAEALKENIENTQITGYEPLDSFIAGTYNTLKLLFGIGDIYTTFITNIATVLQIPGVFVNMAIAAVAISVIFMIVKVITKVEV